MFVHLARSFRNEVKRSALSFLMGNKHLDLPHLWFQFHDNTEHVPGPSPCVKLQEPRVSPKNEKPIYFSVLLVFHDHWVLPALLLMAYWSNKVRPGGRRNEALSARGHESFFRMWPEKPCLKFTFFPTWWKDWKCQKAFCIICMRLRRWPVKGKVWHSSWLGPAEGAPLGVQQKWPGLITCVIKIGPKDGIPGSPWG